MIKKFFLDILAPQKCYSCKKEWSFLCEKCLEKQRNFKSICYVCKRFSNNFSIHKNCKNNDFFLDNVIILTHYKNSIIKKLIEDFKFYEKKDIASDFAYYLEKIFIENWFWNINKNDFLIIYPPTYFLKKIFKPYNSSEILAKKLSKNLWIKLEKNLIIKTKNTIEQKKLSRQKRLSNLENSFKINKNKVDNITWKNIIIIDDIISTWTTINEIAKILKGFKVNKIIWLIIASD